MFFECVFLCVFFFKQKTAYEMRISDWSSDVCSSDLEGVGRDAADRRGAIGEGVGRKDAREIGVASVGARADAPVAAACQRCSQTAVVAVMGDSAAIVERGVQHRAPFGRDGSRYRSKMTGRDRKSTRLNSSH